MKKKTALSEARKESRMILGIYIPKQWKTNPGDHDDMMDASRYSPFCDSTRVG